MPLGVHETGLSIFYPSAPIDVYATGADDDVQINAALAKAGNYGVVRLFGAFYWDDNPVTVTQAGILLDASGASLHYSGTGHAIEVTSTSSSLYQTIEINYLVAEGAAVTSTTAVGLYLNAPKVVRVKRAIIVDFRAGAAIQIYGDATANGGVEEVLCDWISARSCRKGLEFLGHSGYIHGITIGYMFWSPFNNAGANYGIVDSTSPSGVHAVNIDYIWMTPDAVTNTTGISITGNNWQINALSWDDNASGNTSISSTKDVIIGRVLHQDDGSQHFFRDASIPWNSFQRALVNTFGGQTNVIPTNAAMETALVVTGTVTQEPMYVEVNTGATENSSALARTYVYGLSNGGAQGTINWAKRTVLMFSINTYSNGVDATRQGYVQFKAANTIGQLAQKGVGVDIANNVISGESYGSARATVDLTSTATTNQMRVAIFIDPNTPIIVWFTNGTRKGDQETAANIPTTGSAVTDYFLASISKGNTATTLSLMVVSNIQVWQED